MTTDTKPLDREGWEAKVRELCVAHWNVGFSDNSYEFDPYKSGIDSDAKEKEKALVGSIMSLQTELEALRGKSLKRRHDQLEILLNPEKATHEQITEVMAFLHDENQTLYREMCSLNGEVDRLRVRADISEPLLRKAIKISGDDSFESDTARLNAIYELKGEWYMREKESNEKSRQPK